MRNGALWLLIAAFTVLISPKIIWAEDEDFPVGKPVPWEIIKPKPAHTGEPSETPNQRRRRLGEPVVASFPSEEYGKAVETPNQRRKRLGEPLAASLPADEYGSQEETPNHLRQQLAASKEIADRH